MDKNEFVTIIKDHQALINNVTHVYFYSAEDKKDARQEIILQLWKSIPTFCHKSKLSTWIYRVALNTALNLVRKNRSDLQKRDELKIGNYEQISQTFDDDIEYLKYLISCLKEIDKAVVLLHLEGYSNKEVSKMLSLSMTNVSSRLHRIKKHLRKLHITKFYEIK